LKAVFYCFLRQSRGRTSKYKFIKDEEKKRGQTFTLQDKKEVSFPLSFSFTPVKKRTIRKGIKAKRRLNWAFLRHFYVFSCPPEFEQGKHQ